MQQPLASPLSAIKPAYDVVVIGSGYGGGVAASRLARAGQRVCVIEKGKEFPTGSFPSRLPELRRELQLNGGKLRSGSRTGLFDFRLGADIHVLVGCGLGGGSLINAGVALKPDARVFADPVWPEELSADGLLELGFKRAAAMLRPSRYANAPELTKFRALEVGERRVRRAAGRRAGGGELRGYRQSRRRGAARLHAVRRLLLGLQCRRQEHRGHDLSARRQGTWRGDLHRAQRQSPRQRRGGLAGLFRAVGCEGRDSERGRGEDGGARRRHARLDRDPAQIARARARRCPTGSARASPPMATSSPSPLAARNVSTASAWACRRNSMGDIVGGYRRRPDRASRRGRSRPLHDLAGRRAAVRARAAASRVLHRRRQDARRGAEPDQRRLPGPAVPPAYLLRRLP